VLPRLIGFRIEKSSLALSPSPSAAARRDRGALRGTGPRDLLRQGAVATQEDGSSRRLQRTALLRGQELFPQDEDISVCLVLFMPRGELARPDQGLQGGLELLGVGVRPLVENDEIDRQPLEVPVLVRAEELPDDASILRLVDADQDDRQVPEIPWAQRADGPDALRLSTSAADRSAGSASRIQLASS
jgi:hypothetical protein